MPASYLVEGVPVEVAEYRFRQVELLIQGQLSSNSVLTVLVDKFGHIDSKLSCVNGYYFIVSVEELSSSIFF